MLEFVIVTQTVLILGLVGLLLRTHDRLWRVAMSRTPGEFRAAEKQSVKPSAPLQKSVTEIDEAAQLVLASMSSGTMPHGLGGA